MENFRGSAADTGAGAEFAPLAAACKDVFWAQYPKDKKDEAIKLER